MLNFEKGLEFSLNDYEKSEAINGKKVAEE